MSKIKGTTMILTVDQSKDHNAWLAARSKGIGGSDAGTIMGSNPWKSPYQLWLEKTGQVEPEDISQKDSVYWGTVLEPLVAKRFSEITGKKVERCGTLQNNDSPWMLANIDRLVLGEGAGLEIKTTNAFRSAEWDGDQLPDSYYWQCQHYMMTTGLPLWYIAVLIGGQDFRWKAIPRNEEDIKELFLREEEFWNVNVLQHVMPGIDGSDCTREALKEQYPGGDMEELELTKDVDLLLMERQDVMEHLSQYKAFLQTYDNKLKALLGDHELATTPQGIRITYKTQAGRTTIDRKKLEKEWPDIYQQVVKMGKPTRVLRFKAPKEEENNGND